MNLTNEQKSIIHAHMIAEPSLSVAIQTGNDEVISAYYNTIFSPDFIVWRTNVSQEEYQTSVSSELTTFNWSGTGGYIARSAGERDAWRDMFVSGSVNPSLANVIAAFNDIFSGTGAGAVANRSHLLAVSKRKATLLEKLLSAGVGTTVSPATLTYEGLISPSEISEARVWQ